MKIVHLITGLKIGGAETVLYELLARVDRVRNEHCVVYFYDGPQARKIRELGIATYQIKGVYSPYDPVGLSRLFSFIKKEKPDLVHSALWSANILGRIISFFFRIPLVCDLHSNVEHHGNFRNVLERITVRIPHRYVAVSSSVKNQFCETITPAKKIASRIDVIYNGVDSELLLKQASAAPVTRAQFGFTPYDFIFGTVGRLSTIKSYDVLIEAFSCILGDAPSARLCIIGDGPERASLESLVQILKITRYVTFVGEHVPVAPLYNILDCFVQPSQSEGLSIALLEALSFGLPVIATAPGRKHEVVKEDVNGLVINPSDRQQLAQSMVKIYKNSELRSLMKRHNVALIKSHFNIKYMVNAYEKLYEDFNRPK